MSCTIKPKCPYCEKYEKLFVAMSERAANPPVVLKEGDDETK